MPNSKRLSIAATARQVLNELHRRVNQARRSPDQFIEFCFTDPSGQPLRQGTVHQELQAFLTSHRKALVELPRDHGKSVQVCSRLIWELGHQPSLRIKLVCATDSLAWERGRFLRDTISRNRRVHLVFPHLRPTQPWTPAALSITRPANVIGPSVAAFGIGTGSTGARADLLVCDDIVDVRSLFSRAERERVKQEFHNNLLNLLEPDGRFWGLFTPWHPDDLNQELKKNQAFAHFRRSIGPNLETVWPEKWPKEKLANRLAEIGASSFARGYQLLPIQDGERLIQPDWIRCFDVASERSSYEALIMAVDPAVSARATADASAVVIAGRVRHEVHILFAHGYRVSTPELVDRLADLDRLWQPDLILFESNAAFAGIRDLLTRHASFGPRIRGIVQSRSKQARFAALSVVVQNGSVRLSGRTEQQDLWNEMTMYPFASHDDLLDATAIAAEHLLAHREPRAWS